MSSLHTPITIGSSVIRNRLYRAPVLEGAGGRPDGPDIYRHAFEENARAGVGQGEPSAIRPGSAGTVATALSWSKVIWLGGRPVSSGPASL